MFPEGLGQLHGSWLKAFAAGAGKTSPLVLVLCVCWLGGEMYAPFLLASAARAHHWQAAGTLYLLYAAEVAWFARQLGNFRLASALFYPVALVFYFATFAQSAWIQSQGTLTTWRGRRV